VIIPPDSSSIQVIPTLLYKKLTMTLFVRPDRGSYTTYMSRTPAGGIEKEVLETLSAGDLLVGFLLSARSTRRMYKIARERATARYRTKLAIHRLIKDKYILQNGDMLSITNSGVLLLERTVTSVRESLDSTTWDGKWRIVSYDIPESLSGLRRQVRSILKRAGFIKLQNSVWIFPHECRELARLVKERSELKQHILYGVLESIEGEEQLRKKFRIKQSKRS